MSRETERERERKLKCACVFVFDGNRAGIKNITKEVAFGQAAIKPGAALTLPKFHNRAASRCRMDY